MKTQVALKIFRWETSLKPDQVSNQFQASDDLTSGGFALKI
jgi:hypothetical protein